MFRFLLLTALVVLASAYRPLRPHVHKQMPIQGPVGEPLYLTPYINMGDIATARTLSQVTAPLLGVEVGQPLSYSGFLTVNEATNSNMFFWFFPATDVDPLTAPVVIWLQGGPGGSSLFGLLEIHGPIQAVYDDNGDVTGEHNPYSWSKRANMIYIDNPVGAGYSYSDAAGLPSTEAEVADDLYEALLQWYQVFPEYQPNEFYAFGESYGGKFVPTIARKIHDMNPTADVVINLAGIGIGDGFMSPPDSSIYADYLYQTGLVDEPLRDELLTMEQTMKDAVAAEQWYLAWLTWNNEFGRFLTAMGCDYYYEITQCDFTDEEDNYNEYVQIDEHRLALHVGALPFGAQSGDVYNSMIEDFMKSERPNVEFLLDNYKVLIYDGNLDIICNHSGVLAMFAAMTEWSGIEEYRDTEKTVYRIAGETVGYLKSVQNLRLFVMRNAGHMVPRNQPSHSLEMFNSFLDGTL